ncbi:MAG: glycosyl hydrolase [Bacteroidota bacterium]
MKRSCSRDVAVLTYLLLSCLLPSSLAQDAAPFADLSFRNLCPAKTGGRIVDIAVDPTNKSIRYVGVASGNVWKTVNAGTTWDPIFETYGSFSIGVVEIDHNDAQTIWVGTGENNSQRSASMGDGVYKSTDGGKSFRHMGLSTSEHIGKIVIDPQHSNIVYVASQGPLWKDGGERGLYKSIDGGENWKRILHVSEQTGISDVVLDPRNPNILYATAYQRRRHVGMLVAGGPDGGAYKSVDGGQSWKKIKGGFPGGELGRIGLALSPQNPDVVYALVAGTDETKGFYRSANKGERWTKMSDYMVIDAQYYMEIFPDPHQFDRLMVVDVRIHVTEDGGKNWTLLPEDRKHVDSHEIVFDEENPNYLMVGCDGGIYESWDRGDHWRFTDNLPLTQFYRVGIGLDKPFYHVYGGTQDNNTLGGPNQTTHRNGVRNGDWYTLQGGDGFQARSDPSDPNIVYAQYQYAGLVRFNKRSGEKIDIQPQPGAGDPPLRWHWDSPLIISPHKSSRLYFAANKLFKSEDRGNSWEAISGDLTREQDRNRMPVMDRVWGIDAIFKNVWTSPRSTIVSLDESPIQEGLIYVGTDEGLIQVSADGGTSWRKTEHFPGVPDETYIADIFASRHDANVVFAVFNNHKNGDYRPHFLRSDNQGKSWVSISGDLSEPDFGWTIYQDHEQADLLFAGTEYGLHFSVNGGKNWHKFSSGIPTIAIRDLEIHPGENDLIAASFGRGFYILDDYSPLRHVEMLDQEAALFPIADALVYIPTNPDGGSLGHAVHTSANPDPGVSFTIFMKDVPQTSLATRKEAEQTLIAEGKPVYYPSWEAFTAEKQEEVPMIAITARDNNGQIVQRGYLPAEKGLNRVSWNLRLVGTNPANPGRYDSGPFIPPGTYTAELAMIHNGIWRDLGTKQSFQVRPLFPASEDTARQMARAQFQKELLLIRRQLYQDEQRLAVMMDRTEEAKALIITLADDEETLYSHAHRIEQQLQQLDIQLNGNQLIVKKMELISPSFQARLDRIAGELWYSREVPTQTHQHSFEIAMKEFKTWLESAEKVSDQLHQLRAELRKKGIHVSNN